MTEEKTIANMDELELFKRLQKLMILAREKKDIEEELEFRHREGKIKILGKKSLEKSKVLDFQSSRRTGR